MKWSWDVSWIWAGPGPLESASRLNHENSKLGFALPGGFQRVSDHVWNELAALWDEGSLGRPRPAGKSSNIWYAQKTWFLKFWFFSKKSEFFHLSFEPMWKCVYCIAYIEFRSISANPITKNSIFFKDKIKISKIEFFVCISNIRVITYEVVFF